jgi:hypothetical protein
MNDLHPCDPFEGLLCAACLGPATRHYYFLPDTRGRGFPACRSCVTAPDIFERLRRIDSSAKVVTKLPGVCHGAGATSAAG